MPSEVTYYGPYEIEEVEFNGDVVTLKLKDRAQKVVTTRLGLEESATTSPQDPTALRAHRYQPLLRRLAEECLKSSVTYDDIPYVAKQLADNLLDAYEAAASKRLGREFVSGLGIFNGMSLIEADLVLKEGAQNTDGAAS